MRRPLTTLLGWLAPCLLLLAILPGRADAQRTGGRNLRIAFESGNASRNGYADAQVEVTYYFGRCADRVAFLAHYNPVPHMLVGNHRYWYNGRMMEVPPHIAPPRLETPTIRGTIRGNGIAKEVSYIHASNNTPDCFTNDLSFGMTTEFWPANTPEDRRLAILNGFGFDQRGTLPPLRNSAAEAHFSQVLSAAREDSLARARAAEQQRLAARRDSIQRATAARDAERLAQARRDSAARADQQRRSGGASGAGTAAGTAAAAGTGSASASSGGSSGGSMSEAERAAAAEEAAAAQAAAERAAAEERGRAAAEEFRRRVAEDEARQKQMEEAYVAAGVAAAGIIAGLLEANSNRLERKRAREAQERREAEARYQAYVATTKARFDASPARPACTVADVRDTVTLGMTAASRKVTLTMDQCRLSGGQSATLMHVVVDSDAPVIIVPSTTGVISSLSLINAETNRGVASATGDRIYLNLPRGRYLLVVSSRLPGEVGDIALSMRKGWVSDANGSLGAAVGSAKTIEGFVGNNQTSASWMDLNLNFEFRQRFPALTFTLMAATDTDASEALFDVGLRQYFGRQGAKLRPWVEASYGYREIYVLQEQFKAFSPAFGAGIHWRWSEGLGLALSATQLTGEAKNTEDIWTSPPPPVPLGRTIFKLGLMIH